MNFSPLYRPSGSRLSLQFSFRVSRFPNRLSSMALAMGSIIAVVAVLLNHIDRKEEVIIMPKISLERKERQVESQLPNLINYYATIPTITSAIKCDHIHSTHCLHCKTGYKEMLNLCQMIKYKIINLLCIKTLCCLSKEHHAEILLFTHRNLFSIK